MQPPKDLFIEVRVKQGILLPQTFRQLSFTLRRSGSFYYRNWKYHQSQSKYYPLLAKERRGDSHSTGGVGAFVINLYVILLSV